MSVIFIPSKKIYDVSYDKVADNIITSVDLSYNNVTVNYGNILNREYTFNYWRRNSDNSAIEGVYNDVEQTEGFELTATGTLNHGQVTATLRLPYNKLTKFDLDPLGVEVIKLLSHKLKSVQRISVDEGVTFYERTIFYTPTLKNVISDGEKGIIELSFSQVISLAVGDKTQYILSETISIVGDYITTEQTSKRIGNGEKTFAISANSLIQGTNTNLEKFANDILANYGKGKETITIRCSIGEYYDDNGKLAISSKTANKMTFSHYDQVVVMKRNAWGTDSPISLNQDGSATIFEVIGVRKFYDGAVWQELTLKEFNESANIQIQLPAPTIRIADDILYIQDGSGLGKSFQIYVDGNAQVITDTKTYSISNLPSISQGSHSIYVVSLGYGNYTSSNASNAVTYVKKVPLSAPVISIIDSTLVINDTSGKAEQFAVYANGTLILYTNASANTINLKSHITQEGTYTITVSAYADGYTASAMSNEVSFTRIVPLASPTITLSGKTITITDNSGKAETFNVYVENTFLLSTPANQNVVDLSNLIFAEGNYEVFATALAQGYDESAKSNSVTYTVGDIPDVPEVPEGNYLTFVGEDGEFTLTGSDYWDGQVYISTDAQNWSEWNGNSVSSVDSKIYLRGRNNTTMRGSSSSMQAILRFSGSATKVACYGNIANLLDYSKVSAGKTNEIEMADSCFRYFFLAQTRLTRCPELPLTTLSKNCYYEMFSGCTQLSTLPKLPATTLQEYCYYRMFYNCSAIKLSETQSDEYPNEYRIPTEGNISSGLSAARYDMFRGTGGSFAPTGNANILNKTLYTANEIV